MNNKSKSRPIFTSILFVAPIFVATSLPACCPTLKTTTRQHGVVMQQEAETLEVLIQRCKAGNHDLCDDALRKAQAMKASANELAKIED